MNITPLKVETRNEDTIRLLEEWLELANEGVLVSVGLIGKRTGAEWQTAFSASSNSLEDAAMLIEVALRRMGFALRT